MNGVEVGNIYIGVDDKTLKNNPLSVQDKHEIEEAVSSMAKEGFNDNGDVASLIKVFTNEKIFRIQVTPGIFKPYSIGKGFSEVYIRVNSVTSKANSEQIKEMLFKSQGVDITYDEQQSRNQELSFQYSQKKFDELKKYPFELISLELINHDKYTNLGLLMSDQNPFYIKMLRFDGKDVDSNIIDKREFSGSIPKQIDDVLYHLGTLNNKHVQISDGGQRVELEDYPHFSLREIIINSVFHRNYTIESQIKVEIFTNRIVISSPGGFPGSLKFEEALKGKSVLRNTKLAKCLDKLGYIENYGLGIRKTVKSYKVNKPDFDISSNFVTVTLPNQNYSEKIAPPHSIQILGKDDVPGATIYADESGVLLNIFKDGSPHTRKEIQNYTLLGRTQTTLLLNKLIENDVLKQIGKGRGTKYILTAHFLTENR